MIYTCRSIGTSTCPSNHRSNSIFTGVGQTYCQFFNSQSSCPAACPPVEENERSPAAVGQDLNIAPGNSLSSCTQRFHYRFFTGEANCQLRYAVPAEIKLGLCIYTSEESLPPAIDHCLDPVYLNYIYSNPEHRYTIRPQEFCAKSIP